ncbi:MAG: DNA adenine methylase [Pseudomonadota bacterium]
MKPSRPVIRYHGSKYRIAEWVVSHFPPHREYVDVFGGAGSVLLSKPQAKLEVYNDLDSRIVNLFRVLRDPEKAAELIRSLELTPFARDELEACYEDCECPVESARRLIVRAYQGFGADSAVRGHRTGFRSTRTDGFTPAKEWMKYPPAVSEFVQRLQGVIVENKSWDQLIPHYDSEDCFMYLDPPYLLETRTARRGYRHEMEDEEHEALLRLIKSSDSMFAISGYDSDLYNDLLAGWEKRTLRARAEKNKPRIEMLWLCPRTSEAQTQTELSI